MIATAQDIDPELYDRRESFGQDDPSALLGMDWNFLPVTPGPETWAELIEL